MKKLLIIPALTVPVALLLAGCNNSPSETPSDTPPPAPTEVMPASTPPKVPAPSVKPTAKPAKAAAGAADPAYKVVDEGQPNFPSDVLAALQKAKVPPPPKTYAFPSMAKLEISTVKGKIVVQLNGKEAPLHAKSFYYLAKRHFFDGDTFHRYEPGFVIQGGDPLSKNPKLGAPYASMTGSPSGFHGTGGPGYRVPREYNSLKHGKFVLSMARSNDPDSAGSQFFITLDNTPQLDRENTQDNVGYTVFGKVLSGQDVVMKIRAGDKINSIKPLN